MKTYHVAKNGQDSDGFDGDQDHAWASGLYAMQRIKGGDTVIIDNGVYAEAWRNSIPSGTAANPTTIKALNSKGVILLPVGGYYVIEITQARSYITIDGIVADGSKSLYGGYYYAVDAGDCSYIVTQNGVSKNGRNDGQWGPVGIMAGCHHNVAGHHHLSFLNMESFENYSTNQTDGYGFYLTCHDSLVKGCKAHHNGSYALHKYSTGGGVNNNIITENVFDGSNMIAQTATVILSRGDGTQFFKNIVTGAPRGAGVDVFYGEKNCKIYDNQVSKNSGPAVRVSSEPTAPGPGIEIYGNNWNENGMDGVQDDTGKANVHDNTTGAVIPPIVPPIVPPTAKTYKFTSVGGGFTSTGEITLEEIP